MVLVVGFAGTGEGVVVGGASATAGGAEAGWIELASVVREEFLLVSMPEASEGAGRRASLVDVSVGGLPPVCVASGSVSLVAPDCVLRFLLRVRWRVPVGGGVGDLRFAMVGETCGRCLWDKVN